MAHPSIRHVYCRQKPFVVKITKYVIHVRPFSGTAVYPHVAILRVALAPALVAGAVAPSTGDATDSSDFGLLGAQSYQNGRFPAQDADEPPCKI